MREALSVMPDSYIFISYKHGDPWTRLAKRFYTKLAAISKGLGFRLFMDDEIIEGGNLWSDEVERALNETTHFVCFLCDDYWLSEQCRRELLHALNRYEASGVARVPRLLFVLAERMRPEFLTFDDERRSGVLTSEDPKVGRVSDVHFLGPFDENVRLVRLEWNDVGKLSDQMAQLIDRLEVTLKSEAHL
jgi:hypothetical protein